MKNPGVKFSSKHLTITVVNGSASYEIDLERANTPAQLLDWIFQVQGRKWMTPDLTHQLLKRLDDACHAVFGKGVQGVFCPWGMPQEGDWRNGRIITGSEHERT